MLNGKVAKKVNAMIQEMSKDNQETMNMLVEGLGSTNTNEKIENFYNDFCKEVINLKPDLKGQEKDKILPMFLGFVESMYKMKLNLHQNQQKFANSKFDDNVPEKMVRVRFSKAEGYSKLDWTKAFDDAMRLFAKELSEVFAPIGGVSSTKPINLFSQQGKVQAAKHGYLNETAAVVLFGNLNSHTKGLIFPNAYEKMTLQTATKPQERELAYKNERDTALNMMFWHGASRLFVENSGKVKVFFPRFASITSVFWNTELPKIRELQKEVSYSNVNYSGDSKEEDEAAKVERVWGILKKIKNWNDDFLKDDANWKTIPFEAVRFLEADISVGRLQHLVGNSRIINKVKASSSKEKKILCEDALIRQEGQNNPTLSSAFENLKMGNSNLSNVPPTFDKETDNSLSNISATPLLSRTKTPK